MNKKEKHFAETIKNRMAAELSDETLNMIWGWKNKVQFTRCEACEREGRVDLLREMIDELTRDAQAKDLMDRLKNRETDNDSNSGD